MDSLGFSFIFCLFILGLEIADVHAHPRTHTDQYLNKGASLSRASDVTPVVSALLPLILSSFLERCTTVLKHEPGNKVFLLLINANE